MYAPKYIEKCSVYPLYMFCMPFVYALNVLCGVTPHILQGYTKQKQPENSINTTYSKHSKEIL